ncbi:hypothetical protein NDU88_004900 [Pleurodeles waltl]|uniref:Uncharacterized protein n=1 Tax=Pleurodeles waltl TaxID=8319 RepID=A0AAV7MAJ3_PLEWA|nr:hypothetical protein NDU88_004900 [Pleurodeles waltl]
MGGRGPPGSPLRPPPLTLLLWPSFLAQAGGLSPLRSCGVRQHLLSGQPSRSPTPQLRHATAWISQVRPKLALLPAKSTTACLRQSELIFIGPKQLLQHPAPPGLRRLLCTCCTWGSDCAPKATPATTEVRPHTFRSRCRPQSSAPWGTGPSHWFSPRTRSRDPIMTPVPEPNSKHGAGVPKATPATTKRPALHFQAAM